MAAEAHRSLARQAHQTPRARRGAPTHLHASRNAPPPPAIAQLARSPCPPQSCVLCFFQPNPQPDVPECANTHDGPTHEPRQVLDFLAEKRPPNSPSPKPRMLSFCLLSGECGARQLQPSRAARAPFLPAQPCHSPPLPLTQPKLHATHAHTRGKVRAPLPVPPHTAPARRLASAAAPHTTRAA